MKIVDEKEELKNKYIKLVNKSVRCKKAVELTDKFYNSLYPISYGNLTLGDILKNADDVDCEDFYSLLFARVLKRGIFVNGDLKNVKLNKKSEKCLNRSWVEFDEMVYDITLKRVFYKSDFYRIFKPKIIKQYSSLNLLNGETCIKLVLKSLDSNSEKLVPIFARVYYSMIDRNLHVPTFKDIIENYFNTHPKEKEMLDNEKELFKKEMMRRGKLISKEFKNEL